MLDGSTVERFVSKDLLYLARLLNIHTFISFTKAHTKFPKGKRHKETPIMHSKNHQNESQRMLENCDSPYPHAGICQAAVVTKISIGFCLIFFLLLL